MDLEQGWNAMVADLCGIGKLEFWRGFSVNPNAQTLGDGVVPNAPLPAGETTVRYKTEPAYGVMLVSSFSF
jgi:hypothetical protein